MIVNWISQGNPRGKEWNSNPRQVHHIINTFIHRRSPVYVNWTSDAVVKPAHVVYETNGMQDRGNEG